MDQPKTSIHGRSHDPSGEVLRSVSPRFVEGQLREVGAFGTKERVHLEPVPGNPDRHDFGTRVSFRVFRARRPVCFLTLGRNLRDLWMRTRNFARACPAIACKPLFHRKTRHWDLVGVEYFDGTDLESLVTREEMTTEAALSIAEQVAVALRGTRRSSHIEAAAREFDQFSAEVFSSAIFDGLDHGFLRDVVLPFVRSGALKGPLSTQWSNGDFIARNILVDSQGAVRLIDLEFAARTHFHGDDWWRWRTYSRLPPEVRDIPALREHVPHEPWREVYFMLRQVLLGEKVNGARLAVAEAQENMARMVAIIASAHLNFRSSIIYSHLAGADSRPSTPPPKGTVEAQIFLSPSGCFSEEESKRTEYDANEDTVIRFTVKAPPGRLQLRLDPASKVGMVRISSIRVRGNGSEAALYSASGPEDWGRIEVGGGALRLADTPELNLLCLDTDPWMLLPVIEVVSGSDAIACEVALRFSSELRALPDLLQLPALPDHEAARELANLKERIAAHSTELDTRETEVGELRKDVSTAATQLDERLDEIARLKAHINELESHMADERKRANGEIEELRSTLAARIADGEVQAGKILELMSDLSARKHDLAQATARLENEAKDLSEARTHLGLATQQARNLEAELEKLRSETNLRGGALEKARNEIAALESNKADLQKRLDAASSDAIDARNHLSLATEHTRNLEMELDKLRSEAILRGGALEKARSDIVALESRVADSEEQLLAASSDAFDARHHLSLATQHACNLEAELDKLRIAAKQTEVALAHAKENASRLENATADLEGRLRVESAEARHARARVELAAQNSVELEAQLARQRRDAAEIAERLESSNSEVIRLCELQSETEVRLLSKSADLADARSQLESRELRAKERETEIERLRRALTIRDGDIAQLEATAETLRTIAAAEKSRLQAQATARERRIVELERDATLAEAKNQEHTQRLAASHEANAALAENVRQLESDAENARRRHDELTESLLAQNRAIVETERRAGLFMEQQERLLAEAAANQAVLTAALESTRAELADLHAEVTEIGRRPLVRFDAALRGKAFPNLSADKS